VSRCKAITKLISDSMEHKLPLWHRIDLRTHLILCRFCRRFQAKVMAFREFAMRELASGDGSEELKLPMEAKTRIRDAMRQQSG